MIIIIINVCLSKTIYVKSLLSLFAKQRLHHWTETSYMCINLLQIFSDNIKAWCPCKELHRVILIYSRSSYYVENYCFCSYIYQLWIFNIQHPVMNTDTITQPTDCCLWGFYASYFCGKLWFILFFMVLWI